MTQMYFSEGELCPPTSTDWCGDHRSMGLYTSPTDAGVTSRVCTYCRFLERVNKTATCWLWTGTFYVHKGQRTYGQFWFGGRRIGAHVASLVMHKGPIPSGQEAMHSCNVKACVAPLHLSAGTRSQNLLDGFRDNPGVCAGENNGRARLNWDIVHAIRNIGGRTMDLAAKYGVSTTQITGIKKGRKWPEAKCPVHGTAEYRRVVEAVA